MTNTARVYHHGLLAGLCIVGLIAGIAADSSFSAVHAKSLYAKTNSGKRVGRARIDKDGDLYIDWKGPITTGMARYLRNSFRVFGDQARRVYLRMDSPGGRVGEGESVIQVLRRIRLTHRLTTVVSNGGKCLSMCVPIFLQGKHRAAAASSIWMFHDVARNAQSGKVEIDREETVRLFRRYYLSVGVPANWLKKVLIETNKADLWQTGQDLITDKTGIITHKLPKRTTRR